MLSSKVKKLTQWQQKLTRRLEAVEQKTDMLRQVADELPAKARHATSRITVKASELVDLDSNN